MKAKYKIDTLVKASSVAEGEQYGEITGIIVTKEGFNYMVAGFASPVAEHEVTSAYRPVVARKVVAKKTTKVAQRKPSISKKAAPFADESAAVQ